MTIYIGNLSFQAEQEDLLDLFGQYGEVKSASLPLDRETGRKRGFGFVEMATDEDEQKAIDDLQNVEWMGRMIRVNKATPRERTGGGGGGGGGGGRGGYGGGGGNGGGGGGGGGYGGGNRWGSRWRRQLIKLSPPFQACHPKQTSIHRLMNVVPG
jgi:RNA recognition motif-containing protein